jgi:hypothetical protein
MQCARSTQFEEEVGHYQEYFFCHEEQAEAGHAEKLLQKQQRAEKEDFGLHDPACPAEAVWVAIQDCCQEATADPGDGQKESEDLAHI